MPRPLVLILLLSWTAAGWAAPPDDGLLSADSLRAVVSRDGRLTSLEAQADQDRAQATARALVCATGASADELRRIRVGRLTFELAGADQGQYTNKPVFVNGVRLDVLPGQGDQWGKAELPLPPAALATLGERNEVRIENVVGDAFKVRNFQLHLWRDDGVEIVTPPNPQAYTSCGWEYAEGKVFRLGEPLVGITVRIPGH